MTGRELAGFGLYLHWPFCVAKCPYCDFNSHVSAQVDQDAWADAYVRELRRAALETGERVLNSIFFGGGTPSLMEPRLVSRVLDEVARHWRLANDCEITLEANPSSVEAARFGDLALAGVNRVSLGLQALDDTALKRLGRVHDLAEGLWAFDVARGAFRRVSFDLIYARQDQTLADWESELRRALSMRPEHLSLYQLTIEDGTPFGRLAARGKFQGLPQEDTAADMYELTQDLCEAEGLVAYEVSNHAKSGEESRHNLIYWRSGDWLGIGPGAHGRLTLEGQRWATEAPRRPADWLRAAATGGAIRRSILSDEDRAMEALLMGLRLREGLSLAAIRALAPHMASDAAISDLMELGMLWREEDVIGTTRRGRVVLDTILRKLV